ASLFRRICQIAEWCFAAARLRVDSRLVGGRPKDRTGGNPDGPGTRRRPPAGRFLPVGSQGLLRGGGPKDPLHSGRPRLSSTARKLRGNGRLPGGAVGHTAFVIRGAQAYRAHRRAGTLAGN